MSAPLPAATSRRALLPALPLLLLLARCQLDLPTQAPAQSATAAPAVASSPAPAASDPGPLAAADAGADAATSGPPVCRSSLVFQPPASAGATLATLAPLATGARELAACAQIARRSRQRAAAFLAPLSPEIQAEVFDPLTRCYGAGEGAWTFEVLSARSVRPQHVDSGVEVSLRARPVFVKPDGSTLAAAERLEITSGTAPFHLTTQLMRIRTFDWDGDRRAELYFEQAHWQEENNAEAALHDRHWTFTARDRRVSEFYPPAAHADRIEDADGDGRPDLVMKSPWVVAGPCGISDVFYPGPQLLEHSLPGGTFSGEDAAAQGFIAHQCRERPEQLLSASAAAGDDNPGGLPPFRVGCARWWGRSPEQISTEIARTYPAENAPANPFSCFPRSELLRAARVDPPAAFRLRCP